MLPAATALPSAHGCADGATKQWSSTCRATNRWHPRRVFAQSLLPCGNLAQRWRRLQHRLSSAEEFLNPNCVKVVVGKGGQALYFSRAPIPWPRDSLANSTSTTLPDGPPFLRHIGIYAYNAKFLQTFTTLEPTALEKTESLEQLRALEHGYAIAVRVAPEPFPPGVDTPEDLVRVQAAVSALS